LVNAPALHETQRQFWTALTTSVGDRSRRLYQKDELLDSIATANGIGRRARLRVYTRAYFCRLRDALAHDFPRLREVLGARRFDKLARGYIAEVPSTNPSLSHFGGSLPAYSAGQIGERLADLARLEWAMAEVFEETDSVPLAMAQLVGEPAERWPRIRFQPIAAIRIIHASTPIHLLWRGSIRAAALPDSPTAIRVWRGADDRIFHAPMDDTESRAFDLMCAGATFESICDAFSHLSAIDGAREASSMLARWIEDGLIAGYSVAAASSKPAKRAAR
jgi:hypothetical protein